MKWVSASAGKKVPHVVLPAQMLCLPVGCLAFLPRLEDLFLQGRPLGVNTLDGVQPGWTSFTAHIVKTLGTIPF